MTTALERCVGDLRRFAEEHWGQRPLIHHDDPSGAAGLLDLGDVDHLVTESLLRMPAFRLVRDGTPLDPATYTQTIKVGGRPLDRTVRPDRVLDEFGEGATIVLQALHRQTGPVARLCRELELQLTHPVQANAYVTPPTAQGFAVHHDTHDVFVLQTHGTKAWRVYEPLVPMAGPSQPWSASLGDPGRPILEVELAPGDCLYIPRGFPHDAEAQRDVSIHVTIGILAITWLDIWKAAFAEAPSHQPFRASLPVGFADDPRGIGGELEVRRKEVLAWLESVSDEELVDRVGERFWSQRRPLLDGQLERLADIDRIDARTTLRLRSTAVFRVRTDDDAVRVVLGRRELRMPSFCEPALRRVAEGTTFAPADLPGLADEPSRVVLVRRLVREGVLEVVRDAV
jgi:hypothetical protein